MNLSCIHCGSSFSITSDQLGGRGRCPHCHGEIQLPRAEEATADQQSGGLSPFNWIENLISGLGSMIFHMILVLVLALIPLGAQGLPGEGDDVLIGQLPTTNLNNDNEGELTSEDKTETDKEEDAFEDLAAEVAPPAAETSEVSFDSLEVSVSPSGGSGAAFDLGAVNIGGSMGGPGGDFDNYLTKLQRDGLDIVIAFDSTGSMSGEINQVKSQIGRIGNSLFKLVPKTRISVCTYRDEGDEYLVKGLPLTNDLQTIQTYLDDVFAGGGGDLPEAVHEGLKWSMSKNQFRSKARKVILLFGDAAPHQQNKKECMELASDFKTQHKGVVSTVTCRQTSRIPEFVDIAQMGGGEAFLTSDERQIMTQLMVLVFGSRYRGKVIEAFKLMGR